MFLSLFKKNKTEPEKVQIEEKTSGRRLRKAVSDYTVIDLETTGLDPTEDDIIEMSAIRVRDGQIVDTFQSFCRPYEKLSPKITKLTGITNEMLEYAPELKIAFKEFIDFVGNDIVIGHNVKFDISFLDIESVRFCKQHFINDSLDTLSFAKKHLLDCPRYRLCDVAEYLNVKVENAHRALADCMTTYHCYEIMKNKY